MKVSLAAPPGQRYPFAGWGKPLGVALAAVLAGTLAVGGALGAGKGGSGGAASPARAASPADTTRARAIRATTTTTGEPSRRHLRWRPMWPWWDYPGYYPPVALAAVPVEYIERSEQETQTANDWLYCAKAQGYFPYVTRLRGRLGTRARDAAQMRS